MVCEEATSVIECTNTVILEPVKDWYSYITKFHDNIQVLQKKFKELDSLKDAINSQIKRETNNLRKTTTLTDVWLTEVEELMMKDKLKQLVDEEHIKGKDRCCFGCIQCNLKQRYKMSKAADGITKEINALINKPPPDSMITEPIMDLNPVPSGFLKSLKSRVELMDTIQKKLEDDDVDVVAIFGMGAIGKTTLAKEIQILNRTKNNFHKIVMVEISEAPNMKRIQSQIAEQLGVDLSDSHSVEHRATQLYNRLSWKNEKRLVILDNIWEKIDLAKVGIPQQMEFGGKLMVTSRKIDVCKVMGVANNNIFEVRPLDQEEARLLFRARVGKTVEMKEHEEVENIILKNCGGLPLSIVAIADVLKDQELLTWEHYASELEKPSSMHGSIKDANRLINSILGTSYRLIQSEEKRRFFLLACLFPFGSSIEVEDMMRYGIGKGLFQDVDNLNEAIEQANTWANELKSSSLLLEVEDDYHRVGRVKIQDVVRASTISLAKLDEEMFMVEAFPRWRDMEVCQKYTAISLMSGTDHSRLHGLKSDNLQILILDNTKPPEFDDTFCQNMTNLKVLVLSGMESCDEFLRMPNSIQRWKNTFLNTIQRWNKFLYLPINSIQRWKRSLRTLHLERCELGDIGGIGEFVNLVVLCLRFSSVEELPAEAMGNLVNLRLLDLSECRISSGGIQANVLGRLSKLEGLYLLGSNIKKWAQTIREYGSGAVGRSLSSEDADDEEISIDHKYASIDELNKLSYLNVVQMHLRLEDLPTQGDQFVTNLDRFYVHISKTIPGSLYGTLWSRSLIFEDLNLKSVRIISCVKALLSKTEDLRLNSVLGFEKYMAEDLYQEKEHRWATKNLYINKCNKELLDSIKWSTFPNLETLSLSYLVNECIRGHGAGDEAQVGGWPATLGTGKTMMFSNLQQLNLKHLPHLLQPYLLPIHLLPLNLTHLCLSECSFKYIFVEVREGTENTDPPLIKLPLLKNLRLDWLKELESMVEVVANLEDETPPTLFSRKLILESLEVVVLWGLESIVTVWDVVDCNSSFLNLKKLTIMDCDKLKTLCPVSVAVVLVHLKQLRIHNCGEMTEAVKEGDGDGVARLVPFPSLERLDLCGCPKMGQFISTKQCYEFQSLQFLYIDGCDKMQSLSAVPTSRTPNLTTFEYDNVKQSIPEGGEIDRLLKACYQQRTLRTQSSNVQDNIIPHSVSLFTEEAVQGKEFDDIEDDNNADEGDDDNEKHDDDEDEDEDEDEDGEAKPGTKSLQMCTRPPFGELLGEYIPECKQQ